MERLTTGNEFLTDNPTNEFKNDILTMADLIRNFKTLVSQKNIQERQFLVYDGKLKMEHNHQQDK